MVTLPDAAWRHRAGLDRLATALDAEAGGDLSAFTWGAVSPAAVHHPLARGVPGLGWLTDRHVETDQPGKRVD